ncbi:MAG: transcription-repair coupling factor, partial [Spirochaetia bacterium]|nr:transcription-repair coupling factor [Spirochaetia bacterium]
MKQLIHSHLQSYIKKSESYKAFTSSPDIPYIVEGLQGYPLAYAIHTYQRYTNKRIFVIAPTTEMAKELFQDLSVIGSHLLLMPSSGKKLYSNFEGSESEYETVSSFQKLEQITSGIVILPLRTCVSPVPSLTMIKDAEITFRLHDTFNPTTMSETLVNAGYYRSPTTTVPGEFSIHGEIFDFFPHDASLAVRIHGGWDEIEKITFFDPTTQDMVKTVSKISITLLHENDMNDWGHIDQYYRKDDYFFFISIERILSSFHSLTIEAKALYREAFLANSNSI